MNDLNKEQSDKLPEEEKILSAWVDVKLCAVSALERKQSLVAIRNNESVSKNVISSMLFYNELHYGNYE